MASKERLTLMICANATGTHKVPLLVIGKSKNPVCFSKLPNKKPPAPAIYMDQANAWMDTATAQRWLNAVFIPFVERVHGTDPVVLFWDNAPAHMKVASIVPNVKIVHLPENLTSVHQP